MGLSDRWHLPIIEGLRAGESLAVASNKVRPVLSVEEAHEIFNSSGLPAKVAERALSFHGSTALTRMNAILAGLAPELRTDMFQWTPNERRLLLTGTAPKQSDVEQSLRTLLRKRAVRCNQERLRMRVVRPRTEIAERHPNVDTIVSPSNIKVLDADIHSWDCALMPARLSRENQLAIFRMTVLGREVREIVKELSLSPDAVRSARCAMAPSIMRARHELGERLLTYLPRRKPREARVMYLRLVSLMSSRDIAEVARPSKDGLLRKHPPVTTRAIDALVRKTLAKIVPELASVASLRLEYPMARR
jgi:hypothetical protein